MNMDSSARLHVAQDQINIIRDIVNLQMYFRQYNECIEHRIAMVRLHKLRIRIHWSGLAVVYHLAGSS